MARTLVSTLLKITLAIITMSAQADNWAPQFPVGSTIIPINALDQHATNRKLDNLKGSAGLLLLFNRSTTW